MQRRNPVLDLESAVVTTQGGVTTIPLDRSQHQLVLSHQRMPLRLITFSLIAVITLGACGQNQTKQSGSVCDLPKDLQSLSGTYTADNIGINKLGKHIGTTTLTITVDSDGVIEGSRSWSSASHQGHTKEGVTTSGDTETVIGVIHPQTCEIGLAEFGETGSYRGRYLANGTIDLLLIESGDAPLAIRNTYRRQ